MFLVGIDVVKNEDRTPWVSNLRGPLKPHVKMWKRAAEWVREAYPDVSIKSINPVGLSDLFPRGEIKELL